MGLFAVQRDKAISDVLVTEHTGERVDGGFVRIAVVRADCSERLLRAQSDR